MKISIRIGIIIAGLLFLYVESHAARSKRPLQQRLRSVVLMSADGKSDSLSSTERHKATVFVFLSSECPISNSYMPMLTKLSTEFAPQDIVFFGVIADPDVPVEEAKKFGSDFKFPSDILMDSKQELAAILSAHVTPEVVIISSSGKTLYQGRIDDRYVALGKARMSARHNDLRDALTNIADGKKVKNPSTKVIGCSIPTIAK